MAGAKDIQPYFGMEKQGATSSWIRIVSVVQPLSFEKKGSNIYLPAIQRFTRYQGLEP